MPEPGLRGVASRKPGEPLQGPPAWKVLFANGLLLLLLLLGGCNLPAQSETPGGNPENSAPSPSLPTDPPPATLPPPTLAPSEPSDPATSTPAPQPTAAPVPRQLTTGSCCTAPSWAPDGSQVWYVDRPSAESPAGLWGVGLDGATPALVTERLGIYSEDFQYRAFPENGVTVIERMGDGERWNLANGGRPLLFSPDGTQVAWSGGQGGPPFDSALRTVWISNLDGSSPREVLQIYGGGLIDWFPDGRLLVSGRINPAERDTSLWALTPENGGLLELARSPTRLRGVRLSPGGKRLAYQILFGPDENENGLWILDLETGEASRLDLFGAYRWRDENRLLIVPLDLTSAGHQLWELKLPGGALNQIVDPAEIPFRIANGDWSVSPGGTHLAWVAAQDHNIWLLELPNPPE